MKRIIAIALCLVMTLSFTACGTSKESNSDSVTIKMGYTNNAEDPETQEQVRYATAFKEYIEEHSSTIKVELYPSSQLGTASEVVGSIAAGTVQMGIYDASHMNNYDANTMAFILPGVFTSIEEVDAVLDSNWARSVLDETANKTNIMVLGGNCKGLRCFTSKGYELKSVEDIKGHTYRVIDSPMYIKMVEALSANPVPMPSSEMYIAMQNGVVEGQENPPLCILVDKTYEVQDWCVLDRHSPCIDFYICSKTFYDSLTEEQKTAIDDAHSYAIAKTRITISNLEADAINKLTAYGMTIYTPTDEELAAWRTAYAPACEEYMRTQIGDELVDELLSTINEIRSK